MIFTYKEIPSILPAERTADQERMMVTHNLKYKGKDVNNTNKFRFYKMDILVFELLF